MLRGNRNRGRGIRGGWERENGKVGRKGDPPYLFPKVGAYD